MLAAEVPRETLEILKSFPMLDNVSIQDKEDRSALGLPKRDTSREASPWIPFHPLPVIWP